MPSVSNPPPSRGVRHASYDWGVLDATRRVMEEGEAREHNNKEVGREGV
jgi:hypothetical protein